MGGVYDALSTRLADRAGFSVSATLLGEPDFGYLTQTEIADTARRLCRLTQRPFLVDADTGYGNALNVMRTVELFQNAGAAARRCWRPEELHQLGFDLIVRPLAALMAGAKAPPDLGRHLSSPTLRAALSGHPRRGAPTVGDVMGWFKTMTTNEYVRGVKQFGWQPFAGKLWQRNYYEHVARSEADPQRIREYVRDNPSQWATDPENPATCTKKIRKPWEV